MCVAFWSLTHPEYALILCANRDEYLARPTLPAHFHSFEALPRPASISSNDPDGTSAVKVDSDTDTDTVGGRGSVLSGRDVRAEGTWMGISQTTGRVALLTNITEEAGTAYVSSRGTLVASFLADPRGHSVSDRNLASAAAALTSPSPQQQQPQQQQPGTSYAGFNLLFLEPYPSPPPLAGAASALDPVTPATSTPTLAYDARLLTNGGGGGRIRARALSAAERACGGISNGVDGEGGDAWPKVVRGRAGLQQILDDDGDEERKSSLRGPRIADADAADDADSHLAGRLIELLTAHSPVPPPRERAELRNTILAPPLKMSGMPDALYGTRLAQVILVQRNGRVTYVERDVWTLDDHGAPVRASATDVRSFKFHLGSNS